MYIKIYAKPPLPEENEDDASFNLFIFPRKQILEFVCNTSSHVSGGVLGSCLKVIFLLD